MALVIERVKIDELQPDPANARRHGDRNLAAIKRSLEKFGQQKPLVVDDQDIVRAGNGTLLAARELGWPELDVVRSNLSATELKAYSVADNKTSDLSDFDFEQLSTLLRELNEEDESLLSATGFEDFELDPLLAVDWHPPPIIPLLDADKAEEEGTDHAINLKVSNELWANHIQPAVMAWRERNEDQEKDGKLSVVKVLCQFCDLYLEGVKDEEQTAE